jgi:hypothetical protein
MLKKTTLLGFLALVALSTGTAYSASGNLPSGCSSSGCAGVDYAGLIAASGGTNPSVGVTDAPSENEPASPADGVVKHFSK